MILVDDITEVVSHKSDEEYKNIVKAYSEAEMALVKASIERKAKNGRTRGIKRVAYRYQHLS